MDKYKYILASNSPRRKELLAGLGLDFEVRVIDGIDESYPETLTAAQVAQYIAEKKAAAYKPTLQKDELIITADTVVIACNEILGKPRDREDALRMMRLLSGKSHCVVTGVTVRSACKTKSFSVKSKVTFARLDEEGASVLQFADAVGGGLAGLFGYEGTHLVVVHLALPGFEARETVCDDSLTIGGGEQRVAQADDAARRNHEVKLHSVALSVDGAYLAFAAGDHVDDLARELLGHQHSELLDGFAFLTVNLLDDNLGLAHLQLVSLAAHGLDEDAEVQNAAAVNQQGVGRSGLFNAQGEVLFQLFE